jgi:hypothetical protein
MIRCRCPHWNEDQGCHCIKQDGSGPAKIDDPVHDFGNEEMPQTVQVKVHTPIPVAGYTAQSTDKVAQVNAHKEMEERLLRHLDSLNRGIASEVDPRWLAVARTHFEQGFMALNRSVFKPQRVSLPEDSQ